MSLTQMNIRANCWFLYQKTLSLLGEVGVENFKRATFTIDWPDADLAVHLWKSSADSNDDDKAWISLEFHIKGNTIQASFSPDDTTVPFVVENISVNLYDPHDPDHKVVAEKIKEWIRRW